MVLLDTPSRVALPMSGGTDILELTPTPLPVAPELLRRMVEAQRHGMQELRRVNASRSPQESFGS